MHQKVVRKICAAGDVQFKRASLDKVPVHDDAHAIIRFVVAQCCPAERDV